MSREGVLVRHPLLTLILPIGAALGFLLVGQPERALFVAVAAVVLGVAVRAGVPVERGLRRATALVGEAVLAVLFAVTFVPIWALTAPGRRKPRPMGFQQRVPGRTRERSIAVSMPHARADRTVIGTAWRIVGIALVVLGINYVIGYGWERWLDPPPAPAAVADRLGVQPEDFEDPRAEVPAMAAYPWRKDYFREMASVPIHYWPYVNYQSGTFEGRYVNVDGWTRRSYEPAATTAAMPTVSFFGGSKMWGEGQRDEHTIPSMVARYAEEAGIPIRPVNHGQRGWVNWQEMLLFEQLTGGGEAPDLAVFYDGTNDLNAQLGPVRGVPTTTNVQEVAEIFDQTISEQQRARGQEDAQQASTTGRRSIGELWSELVDRYNERSAIRRLAFGDPAGASPSRLVRASSRSQIRPPSEEEVPQVIDATLDVYRRGRDLITAIAARHSVEPVFFVERQITLAAPRGAPREAYGRYRRIVDGLADAGPGVIDVASVLDDHQDTYIDPGHTNEAGAALVARAMFQELEPKIRSWYREHG